MSNKIELTKTNSTINQASSYKDAHDGELNLKASGLSQRQLDILETYILKGIRKIQR